MVIIVVVILVFLGYWLLPPAVRAVDAALSGQKLGEQLMEGRVEIVKLFEQHLPGAAEEKFKVLCEKAETHCKQKDIHPHEYPTLLPELLAFLEFYVDTEAKYRTWMSTLSQGASPTPGIVSTQLESNLRVEFGKGSDRKPSTGYVKPQPVASTYPSGSEFPEAKTSGIPAQNEEMPLGTSNNVSADQVASLSDVPSKASAPTVRLRPSQKTGAIINAYTNSENGYVNVTSEELVQRGSWFGVQSRSALIKGDLKLLERLIAKIKQPDGTLPGKIQVMEFVESEVPTDIADEFIRDDIDYEDAISGYVKRAGNDGSKILTADGERILRFHKYIMKPVDGVHDDIFVEHDNEVDVQAWRSSVILQRNLKVVSPHDIFAVQTFNPIYNAFKGEPEVLRHTLCLYFVILVEKLNLRENQESLKWLKTIMWSLDVSEQESIKHGLNLIPLLERNRDTGPAIFGCLDWMSERQILLFTWLFCSTAQPAYNLTESPNNPAFRDLLLYLPTDVALAVTAPNSFAEFTQKVKTVMFEINQEANPRFL